MVKITNCFIFLAVIFSEPSLYLTNFIYQIVNGSLSNSWQINFTIFVTEFQGVILYAIDSNKTQLWLTAGPSSNAGEGSVRFKFNGINKEAPTKILCGCRSCEGTKVNFFIRSNRTIMTTICNNRIPDSLNIIYNSEKDSDTDRFPRPLEIINGTQTVMLKLGNSGYYVGEGNVAVPPMREQMRACLSSFIFNGRPLQFQGNVTAVLSSCPCNGNVCNGGHCEEISLHNVSCDCSSMNYVGRYCNENMKLYIPGTNQSFERVNNASGIYLAMKWRHLLSKKYCLMEISAMEDTINIWTDKGQLWLDSVAISDINADGTNIMTINITNYNFIIKTTKNEYKKGFNLDKLSQINLGFSKSDNICETFEGAFDFQFNLSELRLFVETVTISGSTATITNNTHNTTTASTRIDTTITVIQSGDYGIMIGTIGGLIPCFIIFTTIVLLLYFRSKKRMKKRMTELEITYVTLNREKQFEISTEKGIYGKIEDNNYDYIQITDTYDTVMS